MSTDFKHHLLEINTDKVDSIPILLQHGESVRKSWISSNPLEDNLAIVLGFPSINFFDMTHRVETHDWILSFTSV